MNLDYYAKAIWGLIKLGNMKKIHLKIKWYTYIYVSKLTELHV